MNITMHDLGESKHMDPKACTACHVPHFEGYDLCHWCSEQKQHELEQRLRVDDGVASLAIVSAWAMFGLRGKSRAAWRVE